MIILYLLFLIQNTLLMLIYHYHPQHILYLNLNHIKKEDKYLFSHIYNIQQILYSLFY